MVESGNEIGCEFLDYFVFLSVYFLSKSFFFVGHSYS
jgi:hypothetical protein